MKGMEDVFNSVTYGVLRLEEVIAHINFFLEEDPEALYSLVIGTDSQERANGDPSKKHITLITATVIHRKGFGGKYFWQKKSSIPVHSLREKIYAETLASLDFARFFIPQLKRALNGKSPNYRLEIHVDIGEHGETREMIKEIVGMVNGNGFVAKTKPQAYAATYVADKHT